MVTAPVGLVVGVVVVVELGGTTVLIGVAAIVAAVIVFAKMFADVLEVTGAVTAEFTFKSH